MKNSTCFTIKNSTVSLNQDNSLKNSNSYNNQNYKSSTNQIYNKKEVGNNKFSSTTNAFKQQKDEMIDPDLYYKVKEENELLKQEEINLNEKINDLNTEFENLKRTVAKGRLQSDQKRIILYDTNEFAYENVKLENEKLKNKNKQLLIMIKGLQSNKKPKKFPQIKKEKKPSQEYSDNTDILALNTYLRKELNTANEDRKNLIEQLASLKKETNKFGSVSLKAQNKFNLQKISDIQTDYEYTILKLNTSNKILKNTQETLKEYIDKYQKEIDDNNQLEKKNELLELEIYKYKDYGKIIEEYKSKEKLLEMRIQDLCENPFVKETQERGNIIKKFYENERNLLRVEGELKDYLLKNTTLEKENKKLKYDLDTINLDKDRIKEIIIKLRILNEEKHRKEKEFKKQIEPFSKNGKIESHFDNFITDLNNIQDKSQLRNMGYLDQLTPMQIKDAKFLSQHIEKIKSEKGIVGGELEKTKCLLQIQQQINQDMQTIQECDVKKYQAEIKLLNNKIDELCKLVDIEKLKKDYIIKDPRYALLNELMQNGEQKAANNLNASITEFSQESTEPEFSINGNALDIYFGECIYEDILNSEIGVNMDNMKSFLAIDFYVHETQTSNLVKGKESSFNLQASFTVIVDEQFLNHLESESINIEIYTSKNEIEKLLGKGKIALVDLIEIEKDNKTNKRVVNKICPIYYAEDESIKIANLNYKMRMRFPISEIFKQYQENNRNIQINQPVNNIKPETTISQNKFTGRKIYDVSILITKANDLIVSGQPRKIQPYFYYKFYKDSEKYSKNCIGNNPIFEDVSTYTVVYDNDLHNYLEKQTLDILIFDNARQIQVDVSNKENVKLPNKQEMDDFIGECKVPLKSLLDTNLVEGTFPVFSRNNQSCGELIVRIMWDEFIKSTNIQAQSLQKSFSSSITQEQESLQNKLIERLAKVIKSKGLDLESAFRIFDIDQKGEISIDNFKTTIWFTLKFTNNQEEMAHFQRIFYPQWNTPLSKEKFFKVFSKFIPKKEEVKEVAITKSEMIRLPNKMYSDESMRFTISPLILDQPYYSQPQFNNENENKNEKEENLPYWSYGTKEKKEPRKLPEIAKLIKQYQIKSQKKELVSLFKVFNVDPKSLEVNKKEFDKGMKKMGIELKEEETNILWKEILGKNIDKKKEFGYREFKDFYNRLDTIIKDYENSKSKPVIAVSGRKKIIEEEHQRAYSNYILGEEELRNTMQIGQFPQTNYYGQSGSNWGFNQNGMQGQYITLPEQQFGQPFLFKNSK